MFYYILKSKDEQYTLPFPKWYDKTETANIIHKVSEYPVESFDEFVYGIYY